MVVWDANSPLSLHWNLYGLHFWWWVPHHLQEKKKYQSLKCWISPDIDACLYLVRWDDKQEKIYIQKKIIKRDRRSIKIFVALIWPLPSHVHQSRFPSNNFRQERIISWDIHREYTSLIAKDIVSMNHHVYNDILQCQQDYIREYADGSLMKYSGTLMVPHNSRIC